MGPETLNDNSEWDPALTFPGKLMVVSLSLYLITSVLTYSTSVLSATLLWQENKSTTNKANGIDLLFIMGLI